MCTVPLLELRRSQFIERGTFCRVTCALKRSEFFQHCWNSFVVVITGLGGHARDQSKRQDPLVNSIAFIDSGEKQVWIPRRDPERRINHASSSPRYPVANRRKDNKWKQLFRLHFRTSWFFCRILSVPFRDRSSTNPVCRWVSTHSSSPSPSSIKHPHPD